MTRRGEPAGAPPQLCPLCGRANGCAMAAGDDAPCWCRDAVFAPASLARAASVAGPARCICARCASAIAQPRASPANDAGRALNRYSRSEQEIPMAVRRSRPPSTVHAKTAELAWAVPQVIAHRMARMASAGTKPTPRDRKEFARMFAEKREAFGESWQAMAWQAMRSQQSFAAALARAALTPLSQRTKPGSHAFALQLQMQQAALAVLGKGLAPVHRRAVANAKRLAKIKLR